MNRVLILKKQGSSWDITTTHSFNKRDYKVDTSGNVYRDGVLIRVRPDARDNLVIYMVDDNGLGVRFKVHQIVLQTYDPAGFVDGVSVDHIDRNRLNNNLLNLRWADHTLQFKNRDNITYKEKKVLCLANNIIYTSCKEAEEELGLVFNSVSRVARGGRKSTGGYEFKYV